MVKQGMDAPDFSLKANDGKTYSMKMLRGSRVVLYFYPKDGTPGCTIEGCAFRDNMFGFKEKGAVVLGVSADSQEAHRKFAQRYRFNFPLLSDVGGKVSKKYGVWKEKSFLGKKYQGIERSTFIIDEKGKIAAMFLNVNPLGHAKGMLTAISMMKPMRKEGQKKNNRN